MIKKFTQGDPSYLLAVCEGPGPVFGVAFVDTTLVSLVTLVSPVSPLSLVSPRTLVSPVSTVPQPLTNTSLTTGVKGILLRP